MSIRPLCFCLLAVLIQVHLLSGATGEHGGRTAVRDIARDFSPFDIDVDGQAEITKLRLMKFQSVADAPLEGTDKLVLVLVEDRILDRIPGSRVSSKEVKQRLATFKSDLANEGYRSRFLQCEIYSGEMHQDGMTLLAIRRFLQKVHTKTNLAGVVLVGSFPEATIVRRWIWKRKNWDVTIAGTKYKGSNRVDFLRIVPEAIAARADIVLADLDGNWENIYFKKKTALESIEAIPTKRDAHWPAEGGIIHATQFNDKKRTFEDFFFIHEDRFERLDPRPGHLTLKFNSVKPQNPELSVDDLEKPNPIAAPEIKVSRINPRQVAVVPNPKFRDAHGHRMLDKDGQPREFVSKTRLKPINLLTRDAAFERELLVRYFDRNHAFRTATNKSASYASIHYGKGLTNATNMNKYLGKAFKDPKAVAAFNDATLLNYVQFLTTPATIKGLSAHSNPWNTSFGKKYLPKELEKQMAGKPWRWKEEKKAGNYTYTPSFAQQGGAADSFLHRTIYENELLKNNGGSMYIHIGCEVNTPGNALRVPYNHPNYGTSNGFQNAESILFFLDGVALASRSKVFYDKPRGFTDELGKNSTSCFGDGWQAYFHIESMDKKLAKNVAGSKRTYPWSIIGDWTLRPSN